ncbi:MAG: adenine phosphoribosyltransferase [Pseudomonadota bacterium]
MDLSAAIRTIPDYPKPGVMFRDITTLLTDARAFRRSIDELVQPLAGAKIDKVAGIEARGFILGGAIAHQLSVGFIPIRKKGKLPHETIGETYELEYGVDEVEIHVDAIEANEKILLVDDLIATGGTAMAAARLIERAGGEIALCSFIIDLPDLGGAEKLRSAGYSVVSLMAFPGH